MAPRTLDLDLLRTLAAIAEEGSFTRAAERVGRTQSAVSLQIQRLEAAVGRPVLVRSKGGTVDLTEYGRVLVDQGRRLLAINDEIFATLARTAEPATVRLGAPEDHSQLYLPRLLERFSADHPRVSVEIVAGPSCQLVPQLIAGALDLMLCEGGHEPRDWPAEKIWSTPLRWIASARHGLTGADPLPLALSPEECPFRPAWLDACVWRGAAERALRRAGRRFRVVSTASSVAGQQAAVLAGIALTVGSTASLAPGLRLVEAEEGLPDLPDTEVLLVKSPNAPQPVTDDLAAHLAATFGPAMDEAAAAALAAAAS